MANKPGTLTRVGAPAPDFSLQTLEGDVCVLGEQRGRVVLLNFFATWCGPCREELPSMEALHRSMSEKPFQMLAILSSDTAAKAEMMAKMVGSTYP